MKIMSKDQFCLYGIQALLDEMQIDYSENGVKFCDGVVFSVFVFSKINAFDIYKEFVHSDLRLPALIFCSATIADFFRDIHVEKGLYFISLESSCDDIMHNISKCFFLHTQRKKRLNYFYAPPDSLNTRESLVVDCFMRGYKTAEISSRIGLTVKDISFYKRSAMKKLKVNSFSDLYFKIKLLECLSIKEDVLKRQFYYC